MGDVQVYGVVAEFNPFHNGHAALLDAARRDGATHIVAVMSGNFVQRADFAVTDKRIRTKAALLCGADLVIELPVAASTAAAPRFARVAVSQLMACGCVDTLCFGSESGDAAPLQTLAQQVDTEDVRVRLRHLLAEGLTFARARELAVAEVCGGELAGLLRSPNNALAVEYIRQSAAIGWNPHIFTMKRQGAAHDAPQPDDRFASASFLRACAADEAVLAQYVPEAAMAVYRQAMAVGGYPADRAKLEYAILSHLRRLDLQTLAALPDVAEGLENRLYAAIRRAGTLDELLTLCKTKRYTMARVRRLILCAFLGITRHDADSPPPYLRILGMNSRGRELVSRMKHTAILPVSASLLRLSRENAACARAAALEEVSGDLYGLSLPSPPPCGYEHSASAVFM